MSKFYGKVGYAETYEKRLGVWDERYTERVYRGDLLKNRRKMKDGTEVNPGITISNEISIVADPYAREHFHQIRWVEFQNSKWSVSDVTVDYPRLILTLGGLYNGSTES